ncbi:hypothetical protein ACVBKF_02450 [Shewanella sp. 0m-11]
MQETEFRNGFKRKNNSKIYETVCINGQFIADRRLEYNQEQFPHHSPLHAYDRRQDDYHEVDLYI